MIESVLIQQHYPEIHYAKIVVTETGGIFFHEMLGCNLSESLSDFYDMINLDDYEELAESED